MVLYHRSRGYDLVRRVPRDLFLYNVGCHYKEQSGDNQADLFSANLIEQQQLCNICNHTAKVHGTNVLEMAKAKYEAEKETLADLIKLRNEMRKEELMEAVIKSDHSYAEIMAFIEEV